MSFEHGIPGLIIFSLALRDEILLQLRGEFQPWSKSEDFLETANKMAPETNFFEMVAVILFQLRPF